MRLLIPSLTSLKLLEEEIRYPCDTLHKIFEFLLEEIHNMILRTVPEAVYTNQLPKYGHLWADAEREQWASSWQSVCFCKLEV